MGVRAAQPQNFIGLSFLQFLMNVTRSGGSLHNDRISSKVGISQSKSRAREFGQFLVVQSQK